jgi:hypothetical protein
MKVNKAKPIFNKPTFSREINLHLLRKISCRGKPMVSLRIPAEVCQGVCHFVVFSKCMDDFEMASREFG